MTIRGRGVIGGEKTNQMNRLQVSGAASPILILLFAWAGPASAQQTFTWEQIKERFRAGNPTLKAGEIGINESRASEITAYLRPNPNLTVTMDNFTPFPYSDLPYRPTAQVLPVVSGSYTHERAHKRELRLESAQKNTAITVSQQADLERNLLFNLRSAFVQLMQAKSVLALAHENLAYYDKVLTVSRDRFQAGDIARVDLNRLELQRVQFESDVQTATVNVRTSKIQLLTLLNDRTPLEQFDVTGRFEYDESVPALEEVRTTALETRPDLKAAFQAIDKAKTDNRLAWANGATDITFGADTGWNPITAAPVAPYVGFNVSFPIRIFDRNQGEKARTALDIKRNERLLDANKAQVFSDVDSAYTTLNSSLTLLKPYKAKYLKQALDIRDTVSFSYQRGGASLLDFLQAQQDYRSTQLNYLNLVGAYLTAASQLNLAVGREVIQ